MRIIRWLGMAAGWAMAAAGLTAAESGFSRTVTPGDFQAAGLGKLSAEELARLDALVQAYRSGALDAARREAAAAAAAQAAAEARAKQAEAQAQLAATEAKKAAAEVKTAETSLLQRAKVLLTPGTKIEYAAVESRIAGEFQGWGNKTLFTLENGQRWQAAGTAPYVTSPVQSPAVKITPGAMGAFFMSVEGVRPRVKVVLVSSGK
jgi:hypothetical protein